ncbi:MAG: cyclase family protein [Bacteroidota bacterium]
MPETYIDLSHTIKDGEITYQGLPAPLICDFISREQSADSYDDGSTFQIARIDMVSNTGTYIDCPFHRYEDGKDLAETELAAFADLPGILIDAAFEDHLAIDASFFEGKAVRGKAVLVHTGWSRLWQTDAYFGAHPYLTKDAAEYLRDQGAKLVGIDAYNIDNTKGKARPVHSILLGEEILIVEHLTNLAALRGKSFSFSAIPPKIEGMGTFPVRAFAKILTHV